MTKQPIRKVINTHFHWDHWQGNQVYAAALPTLEIITSERTKENLTKPDAGVGGLSFIEKQLVNVPKEIEKLKDDIQQASSPEQKARLGGEPPASRGLSRGTETAQASLAHADRRQLGDPQ